MEHRRLGTSGLQVSALAVGAGFRFGDRRALQVVPQRTPDVPGRIDGIPGDAPPTT